MERLQGEAAQLREAAAAHSGAEDEDAAQVIAVLRQQVEEAKAAEAKVRCRGKLRFRDGRWHAATACAACTNMAAWCSPEALPCRPAACLLQARQDAETMRSGNARLLKTARSKIEALTK